MFVFGKPFQPNLMFAGKAGAYPSEATQGYDPDLTHETLDSAGKACHGLTL